MSHAVRDASIRDCLYACPHGRINRRMLSMCASKRMLARVSACLHAFLHAYVLVCLHARERTRLHAIMNAWLQTSFVLRADVVHHFVCVVCACVCDRVWRSFVVVVRVAVACG